MPAFANFKRLKLALRSRGSGPAWPARLAVLACCVALMAGFLRLMSFYEGSMNAVESLPDVHNLSANPDLKAEVAFAASPICAVDQECRLDPEDRSAGWTTLKLPQASIRQQPGYEHGLRDGVIFYRLSVPIPPDLRRSPEPLSFSPGFINHRRYRVFAAGHEIYRGDGSTSSGALAVIPIAVDARNEGLAKFVIKASLESDDLGITHRMKFLVGPETALSRLAVAADRAMGSYFLLFLLSKGSICLVFAILYLSTSRARTMGSFLVFAFSSTLDPLFSSQLLETTLPPNVRLLAYVTLRSLAAFALLQFILQRFAPRLSPRAVFGLGGFVTSAMMLSVSDYSWGTRTVTVGGLQLATGAVHWAAVGIGAAASVAAWRRGKTHGLPLTPQHKALSICICAYFGLITWQFFGVPFVGFDKLALFDLILFYAVTWDVARAFGADELQLEKSVEELSRTRVYQAVAQTARMLAHDVRSPLATLCMAVDELLMAEDPETVRILTQNLLPAVRDKLAMVDDMVHDILEASGTIELNLKPACPVSMIEAILEDMLWTRPRADIAITCEFRHTHLLLVDELKVKRALTNVIENALQAMDEIGRLWIKTSEGSDEGDRRIVVVTIGNSNSFIEPDAVSKVFDPFYTKGKAKGTGLGLAIAHRAVTSHGGRIWCNSSRETGTEFHLSLPAAAQRLPHQDWLAWPDHSSGFLRRHTQAKRPEGNASASFS